MSKMHQIPRILVSFLLINLTLALPNFVFILTDDQDLVLNSVVYMKKTVNLLANQGITFTNAFVNSPICCPSRSSILTGKLARNIPVYNNSISGGCSSRNFQVNFENATIASILKRERNYRTLYAGKYLNQYGMRKVGGTAHVPPGYDWWLGLKGNSRYYRYYLSINGTSKYFADDYLTDKIRDYALEFLRQIRDSDNFFIMLAPPALHAPFTPPPRYRTKFPQIKAPRNDAFNFTSSDKHWLVQMAPRSLPSDVTLLDDIYRNRTRSLLAVDDMVEAVIGALRGIKRLDDTYIILTSDNGFHIGQFTQPWDKRQPYESDIRVPFIARGPGIPKKSASDFAIAAIDFAPTIFDLAEIEVGKLDGVSFKKNLLHPDYNRVYNKTILIKYWGEGSYNTVDPSCYDENQGANLSECTVENWCKCEDSRNNTYSCVLEMSNERRFKYCRFISGFVEAYDLMRDPSELKNIAEYLTDVEISNFERKLDVGIGTNN